MGMGVTKGIGIRNIYGSGMFTVHHFLILIFLMLCTKLITAVIGVPLNWLQFR